MGSVSIIVFCVKVMEVSYRVWTGTGKSDVERSRFGINGNGPVNVIGKLRIITMTNNEDKFCSKKKV